MMKTEDIFTFCQSDFQSKSFAALEGMRRKGQCCDLNMKVGNQSIRAHGIIVAAGIPYFHAAYDFTNSEIKYEEIEELDDLDPIALESLISFAYTGKIDITTANAKSLLVTADILGLDQVRDSCTEFISQRLSIQNIAKFRELAIILKNSNLTASCNNYILKNFEDFSETPDFLSLSYSCVKDLISENNLMVSSEEVVFKAVMEWVRFSPVDREKALLKLLTEVRLIYLPVPYLVKQVSNEELILNSKPCTELINKVKDYHLLSEMTEFVYLKTQPRNSSMQNLYAVCIYSDLEDKSGSDQLLAYYAFFNNKWLVLASTGLDQDFPHAVIVVDDKIYTFLGKSIKIFNLENHEWQILGFSSQSVSGAAVVLHEGAIYCFGSDETEFEDIMVIFNTQSNKWGEANEMKTKRRNAAAASLGDCIYVTGGNDRDTKTNAVEKYNPSKNQWTNVAPMLVKRDTHGCTSMNKNIYVCGGLDSYGNTLNKAEMYDPLTDQWKYISPMRSSKSICSLVPHCGRIYAFGVRDAEMYEPKSDRWKLHSFLPAKLGGAVSISASSIQND